MLGYRRGYMQRGMREVLTDAKAGRKERDIGVHFM